MIRRIKATKSLTLHRTMLPRCLLVGCLLVTISEASSKLLRIDEREFANSKTDDLDESVGDASTPASELRCIHPSITTYDKLLILTGQLREMSSQPRSKRIVGGMELPRGEWPFLASMRLKLNGTFEHLCGAVLIHRYYLLSAAHCFEKFWKAELTEDPDYWMVRLGEHNMAEDTDSEDDIEVKSITRYRGRRFGEFQNDIAFIKLKRPAKLGRYVRHICLPDPKIDAWTKDSHCLAAGWGHLQSNASTISIVPHHVDVPIYDKKNCEESYKELFAEVNREFDMQLRISHEMICAGHESGGKDACQYDSGGPLVCKGSRGWTLAGLVSFGFDCAQPKMPGIYTDVREFVGWVRANIRKDMCARCRSSSTVDKRTCRANCKRSDFD